MQYHIITTYNCNLKCSYCGGTMETDPKEIGYPISELAEFIAKDPDPVIGFYGGEPLLRAKAIKEIMDTIDATYVLQTNGILLGEIPMDHLGRFHTILVSIDGRESVTDGYRGKGVYSRVLKNARAIRRRGFDSDLVARMTVSTRSDIHEDVMHLVKLEDPLFDHVHWQLDFELFWEQGIDTEEVKGWLEGSYDPGISRLVEEWVLEMERTGNVVGLAPFLGIMDTLISGEGSGLRCGSGIESFTVLPSGHITPCPVSLDDGLPDLGLITDVEPLRLRSSVKIGEPCTSCDILGICGGRCLLVNMSQANLKEGAYEMICGTVRHLVGELEKVRPRVGRLVEEGRIEREEFRYPDILNGCEVTP